MFTAQGSRRIFSGGAMLSASLLFLQPQRVVQQPVVQPVVWPNAPRVTIDAVPASALSAAQRSKHIGAWPAAPLLLLAIAGSATGAGRPQERRSAASQQRRSERWREILKARSARELASAAPQRRRPSHAKGGLGKGGGKGEGKGESKSGGKGKVVDRRSSELADKYLAELERGFTSPLAESSVPGSERNYSKVGLASPIFFHRFGNMNARTFQIVFVFSWKIHLPPTIFWNLP